MVNPLPAQKSPSELIRTTLMQLEVEGEKEGAQEKLLTLAKRSRDQRSPWKPQSVESGKKAREGKEQQHSQGESPEMRATKSRSRMKKGSVQAVEPNAQD